MRSRHDHLIVIAGYVAMLSVCGAMSLILARVIGDPGSINAAGTGILLAA